MAAERTRRELQRPHIRKPPASCYSDSEAVAPYAIAADTHLYCGSCALNSSGLRSSSVHTSPIAALAAVVDAAASPPEAAPSPVAAAAAEELASVAAALGSGGAAAAAATPLGGGGGIGNDGGRGAIGIVAAARVDATAAAATDEGGSGIAGSDGGSVCW